MMDLEGALYSTSYTRTGDGGVEMILATAEHGELFRIGFSPEDALVQVAAFAAAAGLQVSRPL